MSREQKGGCLAELDFLVATRWFSTVVFPDTAFVTLFPTTVETLKDHFIGHLNVYRFGGALMVWLVGHRYPFPFVLPSLINRKDLLRTLSLTYLDQSSVTVAPSTSLCSLSVHARRTFCSHLTFVFPVRHDTWAKVKQCFSHNFLFK